MTPFLFFAVWTMALVGWIRAGNFERRYNDALDILKRQRAVIDSQNEINRKLLDALKECP